MKKIPLTQGKVALVDDGDYEWLNQWKWQATKRKNTWYAVRSVRYGARVDNKRRCYLMHRAILGVTDPLVQVDHKNGLGLDNRRNNIREATHSQNQQNSQKRRGCSSEHKGVSWHTQHQVWRAVIRHNGQNIHLGNFKTEKLAAQAYSDAARNLFKEFARVS